MCWNNCFVRKNGAKPWDITLLPCIMVPRRDTGISLDTTWARNGCSTRLSNMPSLKRLSDLKSDEIHRLELWTCGKPTSYATRMVWITRVKIQYDFSINTCTNLLKLMRARCFTKQLSPGECCLWLFQCYRQARQHGTPTVANEAQNPQSLTGKKHLLSSQKASDDLMKESTHLKWFVIFSLKRSAEVCPERYDINNKTSHVRLVPRIYGR